MQVQGQPEVSKPKWLKKLERESWQAELIISGLAILGSLQLPGLLESAEQYVLLNYDRDTLFIAYIAFIYWRIFTTGLIFLFLFHFIVRALWIGLVGLNSVYPGGFKVHARFSEHYQEQLRNEYGDVDGFIQRLDRLGSATFGVGFGVAGIFLNFGLVGAVAILLHNWLIKLGVPAAYISYGFVALLIPLFLSSIISMTLHSKKYQDTSTAKKYLWPLTKVASRVMYPLAGRYILTATNLFSSYYLDSKRILWYFVGAMVVIVGMGTSTALSSDNIRFFIDEVYHRMGDDATRYDARFMESEEYDGIYYRPVIEAPLAADRLVFWVPLPQREFTYLLDSCSLPVIDEDLEADIRRIGYRERSMGCAREYLTVTLNGRVVDDYHIMREFRTNGAGEQFGYRLYLPDVTLTNGENLLEVTTAYPHEETGEHRRTVTTIFYDDGPQG